MARPALEVSRHRVQLVTPAYAPMNHHAAWARQRPCSGAIVAPVSHRRRRRRWCGAWCCVVRSEVGATPMHTHTPGEDVHSVLALRGPPRRRFRGRTRNRHMGRRYSRYFHHLTCLHGGTLRQHETAGLLSQPLGVVTPGAQKQRYTVRDNDMVGRLVIQRTLGARTAQFSMPTPTLRALAR